MGRTSTLSSGAAHNIRSGLIRAFSWSVWRRRVRRATKRSTFSIARTAVRVGSRIGSPALVAQGLVLATKPRLGHAGWRQPEGTPRTILSVHNSGLISDLDVALGDRNDVRLSTIGGGFIRLIGRRFLCPELLDFSQLQHRAQYPDQHLRLQRFLARVFDRYLDRIGTRTVLIGNFTYWIVFDLGRALENIGAQLLVIHKEGLISAWPSVANDYAQRVVSGVGTTSVHRIAVQSEATRSLLAQCGVAPAERIVVVGTPRLDACHAHRQALGTTLEGPRRVIFFTFWPLVGIRLDENSRSTEGGRAPEFDWCSVLALTLEAAVELARSAPHIEVVIKSKSAPARGEILAPLLDRATSADIPNLHVVSKGEGQQLLLSSNAIVALNSTILLEAIAAGIPALVPRFGAAASPTAAPHLLKLSESVIEPRSPEELVSRLRNLCASPAKDPSQELATEAIEVLRRYAANHDGRSSERLRQFLAVGEEDRRKP